MKQVRIKLVESTREKLKKVVEECNGCIKIFRTSQGTVNYISNISSKSCEVSRLLDIIFKNDVELINFLNNFMKIEEWTMIEAKDIFAI